MNQILNTNKTVEDYQAKKLFFAGEPGLIDTVYKSFPKIWDLYKEMKSLDWSEDEFDYSKCFQDFKSVDTHTSEMMIETIFWQWEADSVAAQFPLTLVAPFQPCTEVIEAEQAIMTNELVHANTYSEIVRMSFENPADVLRDMLATTESDDRLKLVNEKLAQFQKLSMLKNVANITGVTTEYNKELDDFWQSSEAGALIVYYFIILCLERIQFMASFAITFTICKSGPFAPIGQAVKKIAQDELEVHAEYRKEVLKELIKAHPDALVHVKPLLNDILKEVIESELVWTDKLFEGRNLIGTNADLIKKWVLYNAGFVQTFMNLEQNMFDIPDLNPLPFMEDWLNMNAQQAAPQEQDIAAYKINVISRDDEDTEFDI